MSLAEMANASPGWGDTLMFLTPEKLMTSLIRLPHPLVILLGLLLGCGTGEAATLYWFGNTPGFEGGSGGWGTAAHWSTSSGSYSIAPAIPSLTDTGYFGGVAGTVGIASGVGAGNVQVETSGYVFSFGGDANWTVNGFSGSELANSTVTNTAAAIANFVTAAGSTANFTGSFEEGTGTLSLRKQGDGRVMLSGLVDYSGSTQVNAGVLSIGSTSNLGGGNLSLTTAGSGGGGAIEMNGSFIRALGTGAGQVQLPTNSASGGFGAVGGDLTINFGGAAATVSWTTSTSTNIVVKTLVLGTASSTHTTFLLNNLDISGDSKILRTENGAAFIDADLTGTVSGGLMSKTGDGTARINNYSANNLTVNAGTLLIDGNLSGSATRTLTVDSGATFGGKGTSTGTNARNTTVSGTFLGGHGLGDGSFSLRGDLTMNANSTFAFGLTGSGSDQIIRLANVGVWSFQADQQVQFYDLGATNMEYALITGLNFASDYDVSSWQVVDSGLIYGTFRYELDGGVGTIYFNNLYVIPEPTSLALLFVGLSAIVLRRRLSLVQS